MPANVHADDSVCPAHKDMLTRRDAMWFVGVLITALTLLGGVFLGELAGSDRVERNERDIRELRNQLLTEVRELRADTLTEIRALRADIAAGEKK